MRPGIGYDAPASFIIRVLHAWRMDGQLAHRLRRCVFFFAIIGLSLDTARQRCRACIGVFALHRIEPALAFGHRGKAAIAVNCDERVAIADKGRIVHAAELADDDAAAARRRVAASPRIFAHILADLRLGAGHCGNNGRKSQGKAGQKSQGIDLHGRALQIVEYFQDNAAKQILRVAPAIPLKRNRPRRIKA
ncbi:hypothetical protein BSS2_I0551 [Brucella suis bv. 1 str. S2]|uniref:Uncharacterized protein n=5 Tax=Brucella TaxID=234 RepID=Q2YMR5_BRUA2|nr:hypothetical protein BR0567 [Brucella suis 1330]ABX61657.1 Hypothetical protein, conserved [Brucella canis ATCC 23365]ABY37678.1 Hypothetical protein, conserved [Brucella suis ATCC 23445]ACU47565.1 hypothetical protein BMI_I566 [Brucella microti CCM 4915]AEU05583.1 hypothetical protein BSVBI22_A0563 [Brucella suis VBI22]AHN46207.1 hypothetical protein BSS2_I0551 [Brucella suis bv. 1 str. S2]CAJ10548.1 conserved hypothetical protein [Brucella abortus 2308]CDL75972.1 unnamed protein product